MQRIVRLVKWSLPVVVLFVTTLAFFIGQPLIIRGNVNAKGYHSTADQLSSDQVVNQQLSVEQFLTHAILTATPSPRSSVAPSPSSSSNKNWPKYSPPPRVDPLADPTDHGDMIYHNGPVVDGIANIYLI